MKTYTIRRPPVRLTAVEGVPESLASQWMRDSALWFENAAAAPASRGRVATIETPGRQLAVKHDELRAARRVLCALLGRPSRSARAFRLGLALADADVNTARPLALIERCERGGKSASCLVMERVVARSLREYLIETLPRQPARQRLKAALLRCVAREIARLHRVCFRQRDLKAANILVEPREDGEFEVSLIDFDGMTLLPGAPLWRIRARDLARLGVSMRALETDAVGADVGPGDWEYLVSEYLEAYEGRPPQAEELAKLLRAVALWAARKIRRNRWRRRPVT